MYVLFSSSFVCISAYVNVYFNNNHKTKNIKIILIAGVFKTQVVPVYLIAVHLLCAFLMYLARYLFGGFKQTNKKTKINQ